MSKTDKELAVDIVNAYISVWFSRPDVKKPLDEMTLRSLVESAFSAVHSLSASDAEMKLQ